MLLCFGVIEKNVFSRNLCDIISFPIDQAVKGGSDLTTFFRRTSVAQPQPGYDVCSFSYNPLYFFFSLSLFSIIPLAHVPTDELTNGLGNPT
jgi:hypothetical protein